MKKFTKLYLVLIFWLSSFFMNAQEINTSFYKDLKGYHKEKDWVKKAEMLEGILHIGLDETEYVDFQFEVEKIGVHAKRTKNKFLLNYSRFLTSHVLVSNENYKSALSISKQALTFFKSNRDFRLAAYASRDIGACHAALGQFSLALQYFTSSNFYFKSEKNKLEEIHNNVHIASVLIKTKQYKNVDKILQESIEVMIRNKKYRTVFDYYNILSDMYSNLNDTNMVKFCNKKSYEYALKSKNLTTIALAQNNLAISKFYEGDIDESLALFNKALVTRLKTGKKRLVCESYYNIASVYQETGNLDESINFYTKSLDLAKKHELLSDIGDAYLALAQINKMRNNFKAANEFNELYITVQEKIQIQNLQNINGNTFEIEIEDPDIFAEGKKEKNWTKTNLSLLFMGIGYFFLFIILLIQFKKSRKVNLT